MSEELSAENTLRAYVLEQLEAVVIERVEGQFVVIGSRPSWFRALFGDEGTLTPEQISDRSAFLDNFLNEATDVWARGVGPIRSGIWAEEVPDHGVVHLEAIALAVHDGRDVLVVETLEDAYENQRRLLQRAREKSLSHLKLTREIQKKEVLLHCIVHDLKQPLNGIVGNLSLLRSLKLSPEKTREVADRGLAQVRRQVRMIRLVLDVFASELERFEEYHTSPDTAPDAIDCARRVGQDYESAFKQRGVRLVVSVDEETEARVIGREDLLERMISNLVDNALRHSDRAVELRVVDRDDAVEVSVLDDGPGVPPELVDSLFDRFVRGPSSGGLSGLGLYFCRFTVEQWGGSIRYEPREPSGSTFCLRLPKARA